MIRSFHATRRSALALFGLAPAAAPIAAKRALDFETKQLMAGGFGGAGAGAPSSSEEGATPTQDQKRLALRIPVVRSELTSLLYEEQQGYNGLDPDLACLHSMSLNARLAFQRQRNVQRRLKEIEKGWIWQRFDKTVLGAIGRGLGLVK